jgi:hypothetical protein
MYFQPSGRGVAESLLRLPFSVWVASFVIVAACAMLLLFWSLLPVRSPYHPRLSVLVVLLVLGLL